MQEVSEAWKEAHKQPLLPETFVEITVDAIDPDAINELVWMNHYHGESFSNVRNVVNGFTGTAYVGSTHITESPSVTEGKYAFLEYNLWSLDGTRAILTDTENYVPPGLVSQNLGYDEIWFVWQNTRTSPIPGITIQWSSEYDEYATEFTVLARDGELNITDEITISDNRSNISSVELPLSKYYQIAVFVHEWSFPDHRMRIDNISFGHKWVFDKNSILSYTHEQTGDLTSLELPTNKIEFTVDNSDGRWNLLNPNGLEKYLYERQSVSVRYGMDINGATEWIPGGKFYLSEWRAPSNGMEARFVARDIFEFLLNVEYTYVGVRLTAIVDSITIYENPTTESTIVGWYYRGDTFGVTDSTIVGETPNAVLWWCTEKGWIQWNQSESKTLYFSEIVDEIISKCDLPADFTVSLPTNWSTVHTSNAYLKSTAAEILQLCANYACNVLYQDRNGTLVVKWLLYDLSGYVISGFSSYSHPEVELAKPIKEVINVIHPSGATDYEEKIILGDTGETIKIDNPLSTSHLSQMSTYYERRYAYREIVSGEFRADPRLDLFDVVEVETKYGVLSPVMITSIKYTYNGSFHGSYTGRRIGAKSLS